MNDLERKEALEARKEALEAELKRRKVAPTTSELQAAYVLGLDVLALVAERDDAERDEGEAAWGDEGERPKKPLTASERQAAHVTRGRS